MAAIAYPTKSAQTRRPQPSGSRRRRGGRPTASHLRLVEAPLFAEPIFEELTNEALAAQKVVAPWREPEVLLPRHQLITDFATVAPLDERPLPTYILPTFRRVGLDSGVANDADALVVDQPLLPQTKTPLRSASRYRLRRLVAGIALGGLLFGALSGASALTATHQGAPVTIAGSVRVAGGYEYTVQPGDTLWSIASRVYPSGDPRPLIAQLSAQLDGRTPQPGQQLRLP